MNSIAPVHPAVSRVTQFPASLPETAMAHFAGRLAFETDCSDVHDSLAREVSDFVLLDVRGNAAYRKAHVPGALKTPCSSSIAPARTATAPTRARSRYPGCAAR